MNYNTITGICNCIIPSTFLKYLISFVIILFVSLVIFSAYSNIYASSPVYSRQEIQDKANDTIVLMAIYDNQTQVKPKGKILSDNITSVTYSSDGKVLNSTIWLKDDFKRIPYGHIPSYFLVIDIDSNKNTGVAGIDYSIELSWDSETKKWVRQVSELSSDSKFKVISRESDYKNIPDNNASYISLYFNLTKAEEPSEYNIAFLLQDIIVLNNKTTYVTADFTNWAAIPYPIFEIIPSISSINLQQGEKKVIETKIISSTKIPFNVYLNTSDDNNDKNNNINSWFTTNGLTMPPKGWLSNYLNIEVSNNATPISYTITLSGLFQSYNNISNVNSTPIYFDYPITINVDKPLSPHEQFVGVWNTFGPTLKDSYALISTIISAVVGLSTWILAKVKRKRDNFY